MPEVDGRPDGAPPSPAIAELTPIQAREREYYNQFSELRKDEPVCFDPIAGREQRPWNSYWEATRLAQTHYQPGRRLLDFGCGWGAHAVVYAKIGYAVDGFDLSEGNLAAARSLAERYGVASQITLTQQTAERLTYADDSFDVIVGVDILHHVAIPAAIAECRRVLKPGGVAVFREPIRNPVLDALRNTPLVRRLRPNDASLDRHITHDEEKLTPADLATIRQTFPQATIRRFQVLSRGAAVFKNAEMTLERVDYALRWIPGYQWWAGAVVLELRK
ncbi:MAG TPA: class I SAM-dependent methyltransferase [Lacipirellulaceae bacterium]|nr:class I SAM-dependent methyltransferase [Lacipirellulaceae bacterium]